jgi:hypothetical protein
MAVRVFGSVLVVFLYTLTLTVVQLRTVAGGYAAGNQGLNLYTPSQVALLDWANRGLIMVGMLLLPSFLFLTSYMSTWVREQWGARYLQVRGGVVDETTSITGSTVRTIVATAVAASVRPYPGRQLLYVDAGLYREAVAGGRDDSDDDDDPPEDEPAEVPGTTAAPDDASAEDRPASPPATSGGPGSAVT